MRLDTYSVSVHPQASLDAFGNYLVSHCDGLLICHYKRIVVWNSCTGQTKWIQPRKIAYYFLGFYQDNKYGDNSYKILCFYERDEIEIYEINSSFWRTLDVTSDYELQDVSLGMSLKGKTYWCAFDLEEKQLGMFLVSFDYTTERFERLLLPCHCPYYYRPSLFLSVVRDEKLSVLLQLEDTSSRTEIWVTNKIDESTKVVSWSKVLTVDLKPDELCTWNFVSFLVDEEKKFLLLNHMGVRGGVLIVYNVGEDNIATQMLSKCTSYAPFLFHYVPSLTQIQQCK